MSDFVDEELKRQREALVWQVAYYSAFVGIILGLALVFYAIHFV